MKNLSRRSFIRSGFADFASLTIVGQGSFNYNLKPQSTVDKVKLGNSGLSVSRIALGTGSVASSKSYNQTRLGMDKFADMAQHAYDRGITFFDMADSYESHPLYGQYPRCSEQIAWQRQEKRYWCNWNENIW